MPAYGLPAQIILTTPLLVGLDGVEKMSKSLGNYVGIDEAPEEMLRKIVEDFRGSDEVLWTYFTLLTDLPPSGIAERQARFAAGEITASDLRYDLGQRIVADYHGAARGRGGGAGGAGASRGAAGTGSATICRCGRFRPASSCARCWWTPAWRPREVTPRARSARAACASTAPWSPTSAR